MISHYGVERVLGEFITRDDGLDSIYCLEAHIADGATPPASCTDAEWNALLAACRTLVYA